MTHRSFAVAGKWPEIGHYRAGRFKRTQREGKYEEMDIEIKA